MKSYKTYLLELSPINDSLWIASKRILKQQYIVQLPVLKSE
jgi:hypothetical protein